MRCKPGVIAEIIRSPYYPTNVGKWVEVIELEDLDFNHGWCWVCKPALPLRGWGPNTQLVLTSRPWQLVSIPDAWLRPIPPGELSDDTDTDAGLPRETVLDVLREAA